MKPEVPTQWGAEKRGWHLDKTVSVSHIITTALIAVSVITWAMSVDRRINDNATAIEYISKQQADTTKKVETVRLEIKTDLRDISNKLDRLIESQMKK
jgi:hypothetical protein